MGMLDCSPVIRVSALTKRQQQLLVAPERLDVGVLAIEIARVGRVDLDLLAHLGRPVAQGRPEALQVVQPDVAVGEQLDHVAALTVEIDPEARTHSLRWRQRK